MANTAVFMPVGPRPDERVTVDEVRLGHRHGLIGPTGERIGSVDHLGVLAEQHGVKDRSGSVTASR